MIKNDVLNLGRIDDVPILYTYGRLNRKEINNRFYVYDIQSLDDGMTPKYLANFIRIHHYATVISNVPLLSDQEVMLDIEEMFKESCGHMNINDYEQLNVDQSLEMRI